jgi:hypothetical protein
MLSNWISKNKAGSQHNREQRHEIKTKFFQASDDISVVYFQSVLFFLSHQRYAFVDLYKVVEFRISDFGF